MITKLRLFLLYSFPAALFCSYFPLIPIGSTASANYELSLPLIWLFLFSILSLKDFAKHLHSLYQKFLKQKSLSSLSPLLFYFFPAYLTLSTFWSSNLLRAILTAGIFWCLIITGVVVFDVFRLKLINRQKFLKIFLLTSSVFCIICWLQSFLDVFGVEREITLLCSGCTSYSFGFPHPSGLAIEPQFMGNLLLAPTLVIIHLWIKPQDRFLPFSRRTIFLLSLLFSSTLFLTFSRGAIYSFILGFSLLFILEIIKLKNRNIWRTLPLLLVSALVAIMAQGVFSALSPTNSTFLGGIEKSISQMTLGKVNLTLEPKNNSINTDQSTQEATPTAIETPVFSGYVEESTNVRLDLNRFALELFSKNARTLLFGYGLGSAGEIMYQEGKTTSPLEIVQNEYLSLLLETGLIGLLLAPLSLIIILSLLKKTLGYSERFLLYAILASFLSSLLFFSGLPNALHVYLFPVFLAATLPTSSRKQLSSH